MDHLDLSAIHSLVLSLFLQWGFHSPPLREGIPSVVVFYFLPVSSDHTPLLPCLSLTSRRMYHQLLYRQRESLSQIIHLLRHPSPEMALDPRFYAGTGLDSQSSASSGVSAATGITSPSAASTTASAANLQSSASSPSLRARESIAVPVTQDVGSSPGGNVRVVVRVRKFLPRGM